VDGRVLPAHAFDPTPSPLALEIPMIIGNTYAEFGGGMNNPTAQLMSIDQVRERLTPTLGAKTGEVIDAYQRTFPNALPFEIYGVIQGTQAYRINAVTQAERKTAQKGAPVYMYWFGWKTPVLDGRPLAYHCQDLAFWFDNIDLAAQATGGTDDARALATKMSGALVAFARTGNPSQPLLLKWPAFSEPTRATMVFENDKVSVKNDPDGAARQLLRSAQRA
jgi:para-nitrobenzyl esterase